MSIKNKSSTLEVIQNLLNEADKLFPTTNVFPVDGSSVVRRQVVQNDKKQPFIEWFEENVAKILIDDETIIDSDRLRLISGRAGQGKSTLLRHMFVHAELSQKLKHEQIQPNFGERIDTFFERFCDRILYYQAREFPKEPVKFDEFSTRYLVIVDGIDEMDSERMRSLSKTIQINHTSVFLISSRSRYSDKGDKDVVINQRMLEDNLSNFDININLSNNSAHLEKMDKQEKAELLNLLKNYDEGQDYSLLETLIENDSPNVSRPADLLLYRACAPKTNSEYYIYHFSWLIDRNLTKE